MKTRFLAYAAVLVPFAAGATAQEFLGSDETIFRSLYYPGSSYSTDEIYIFPLAATETALAFASCPFVELPNGSGDVGTVCHVERLELKDDLLLPASRVDIKGCTIADHWNIDCPDFTAEGITYGNSEKLLASLRKTYPTPADLLDSGAGVTTDIIPFTVDDAEGADRFSEYTSNRLRYDFNMFDDCDAYANEPAFAAACARATAAPAGEISAIGVTAMIIGERHVVCVIAEDWTIPACATSL